MNDAFLPPLDWLNERFYLDEAGLLRHRFTRGRTKAGSLVGTVHKKSGYVHANVVYQGQRKKLAVHRIVLSMHEGALVPDHLDVDHRDRDRQHNRPGNLVKKTRRSNLMNRAVTRGCTRTKAKEKPFRAMIQIGTKRKHLGYFPTEAEARAAYDAAAAML